MTDTTRLPDASEYRILECSVCSSAATTMEAEQLVSSLFSLAAESTIRGATGRRVAREGGLL